MKKATCFLIAFLCLLASISVCAQENVPDITAKSAIMIDAVSGQILYEKNKEQKVYPASITKILTVYLAVKDRDPQQEITASKEAIDAVPKDSTNIAIDYGEVLTVEQAANAAMLMSANDACNLLAENTAGTMDAFVKQMNTTAQYFGATATNFTNTNGLPDENHYTTAQDFAKITQAIIQQQTEFNKYFSQVTYSIPPTNKKSETRNFVSKHRMMHMDKYKYLGVVGGKTGYTTQASHTGVTYAKKDGKEIIVILFGAESLGKLYEETEELLLYAYNNFTATVVTAQEIGEKIEGKTHYAPQGKASFYLANDFSKQDLTYTFSNDAVLITDKEGNLLSSLPVEVYEVIPLGEKIMQIVWKAVALLVILVILWYVYLIIKARKRRKQRRKQRRREEVLEKKEPEIYK